MNYLSRGDLLVCLYRNCFSIVLFTKNQKYEELVFRGNGEIAPYNNFICNFKEAKQKGYVLRSTKGIVYESSQ